MSLPRSCIVGLVGAALIGTAALASGVTYAATAGNTGARACVTNGGLLALAKSNGSCPSGDSPATLGATGPAGAPGTDGTGILSGAARPSPKQGVTGDFYIDTTTHVLYGPAVRPCHLLGPCGTTWGNGFSLVGPPGAPAPGGVAYQATGSANMPNGTPEDVATVGIPVAGQYELAATVTLQHDGNDTAGWYCTLVVTEANGDAQNESEASQDTNAVQAGAGGVSATTISMVAGVLVSAGAKATVQCGEDVAKKGDEGSGIILATAVPSISGAFNP